MVRGRIWLAAVLTTSLLVLELGSVRAAVAAEASSGALDTTTVVTKENRRGTLACSAQFVDDVLTPGRPIEISLSVTNLSDRVQMVGKRGRLEIRRAGGEVVWSTETTVGGRLPERRIGPGRTDRVDSGVTTRVGWSGPLEIRPVCPGSGVRMPWIPFAVAVPTPSSSTDAAIASAVAYPGSPWAHCPPGPGGEPTVGEIPPPDGAPLEPLSVRCWADVRHEDGFDVVALSLVAPSDAPEFQIPEPVSLENAFFGGGDLPSEPMFVARWTFVVTSEEARPVLSQIRFRTSGPGTIPEYVLSSGTWTSVGGLDCGGTGAGVIPTGRSIWLMWVTQCASGPRSRIAAGSSADPLTRTTDPGNRHPRDTGHIAS